MQAVPAYRPPHKRVRPLERTRETVLAYQCPSCKTTSVVHNEGIVTHACGAKFYVSESEGLVPTWAM